MNAAFFSPNGRNIPHSMKGCCSFARYDIFNRGRPTFTFVFSTADFHAVRNDECELIQVLPVGSYFVSLQEDWQLLRETPDGYVPASDAVLLSSPTQKFSIGEAEFTDVVFAFRVDGATESTGGYLRLSATVQEGFSAGEAEGPADAAACSKDGLVAYYPFDGTIADLGRNGLDGAAVGDSVFAADRCGRRALAYNFNGQNAYIDLGSSVLLKPAEQVSVSTWVLPTTFEPFYQNLVSDHGPNEVSVDSAYALRFADAELQFLVGGVYGMGTAHFAGYHFSTARLDVWSHVAGTYDGKAIRLYVDGVLVDSSPYDGLITQNENPVWIGNSGFEEFFAGRLDDLRIYDKALSQDEIACFATTDACE